MDEEPAILKMIFDLQEQRERALQRARTAISEMEIVLREMSPDSPNRYLVKGLIKTMKRNEATLAAGILPRRATSK